LGLNAKSTGTIENYFHEIFGSLWSSRFAQVVVVSRSHDVVARFLSVVSYFIRSRALLDPREHQLMAIQKVLGVEQEPSENDSSDDRQQPADSRLSTSMAAQPNNTSTNTTLYMLDLPFELHQPGHIHHHSSVQHPHHHSGVTEPQSTRTPLSSRTNSNSALTSGASTAIGGNKTPTQSRFRWFAKSNSQQQLHKSQPPPATTNKQSSQQQQQLHNQPQHQQEHHSHHPWNGGVSSADFNNSLSRSLFGCFVNKYMVDFVIQGIPQVNTDAIFQNLKSRVVFGAGTNDTSNSGDRRSSNSTPATPVVSPSKTNTTNSANTTPTSDRTNSTRQSMNAATDEQPPQPKPSTAPSSTVASPSGNASASASVAATGTPKRPNVTEHYSTERTPQIRCASCIVIDLEKL
jgi:hypothetical protein